MTDPATGDVLFERAGPLGLITLNRPQALNAVTLAMIRELAATFDRWEKDKAVRAIVIRGAGERAFCAGGDVKALYVSRGNGDRAFAATYYSEEYPQNRRVFRYSKPYLALIDGIAMGGGVGLSVHGSHRIATERTIFAMPETGIGLFPDVGGSYFLPRLPGEIGTYLGLTGARLKAADCLYTGIATHYVPSTRLDDLVVSLGQADWRQGRVAATKIIDRFAEDPGPPPLRMQRGAIDRCFAPSSVEEILAALGREGSEWGDETARTLAAKSPTSLKLTYRQLRLGKSLDFEAAMIMEYRLCQFCMDGHDFYEGVRAAVIDKDNEPDWRPKNLAEVSDAEIARAFAPRGDDLKFD
jgi:enoyl-CoA hydratase